MLSNYYQRVDHIRADLAQIDPPPGTMLISDGMFIQHRVFTQTVKLMLDVIDDLHFGPLDMVVDAIAAIEAKVGVDNSVDTRSMDYQLRALNRRVDALSMGTRAGE